MRILHRYVFREVAAASLVGTILFTLVLFLQRVEPVMELLVGRGAPAAEMLRLLALTIPQAFPFTVPIGVLTGILPDRDTLRNLSRKYPGTRWRPLPLRLVKYTHATSTYVLGTTLLAPKRYRIADLADLYQARWGIEEMYKISKQFLEIDQFHGQRERLVKQELYAHFNLIAMARLFTNRDADRCQAGRPAGPEMVPTPQGRDRLGTSMPTPMPMH